MERGNCWLINLQSDTLRPRVNIWSAPCSAVWQKDYRSHASASPPASAAELRPGWWSEWDDSSPPPSPPETAARPRDAPPPGHAHKHHHQKFHWRIQGWRTEAFVSCCPQTVKSLTRPSYRYLLMGLVNPIPLLQVQTRRYIMCSAALQCWEMDTFALTCATLEKQQRFNTAGVFMGAADQNQFKEKLR